ncbi:MAG TPA: hypothetical protein VE821_16175, partial [Pyrinomonadaceae bacterium]|nr:hypothetical protein [Pyrinomonadaceae bacterium]
AAVLPRLENFRVEIAEEDGELRFLYRITPGSAERSYGVYAAKLAGLPRPVVRRAEELLHEYETQAGPSAPVAETVKPIRQSSADTRTARLTTALLELDLNTLSPIEALMKLYELRRLAEDKESDGEIDRALRTA